MPSAPQGPSSSGHDVSHSDIINEVRDLKSAHSIGVVSLQSEISKNQEHLNRIGDSLEANWCETRAQGNTLVRMGALQEADSKAFNSERDEIGQMHREAKEHQRMSDQNRGIYIHPSTLRLATFATVTMLVVVIIIASLVGAKIPGFIF